MINANRVSRKNQSNTFTEITKSKAKKPASTGQITFKEAVALQIEKNGGKFGIAPEELENELRGFCNGNVKMTPADLRRAIDELLVEKPIKFMRIVGTNRIAKKLD